MCPLGLGTWWRAVRTPLGETQRQAGWPCLGGRAKPGGCLHMRGLFRQGTPMSPVDLWWAQGSHSGRGASGHVPQGHQCEQANLGRGEMMPSAPWGRPSTEAPLSPRSGPCPSSAASCRTVQGALVSPKYPEDVTSESEPSPLASPIRCIATRTGRVSPSSCFLTFSYSAVSFGDTVAC